MGCFNKKRYPTKKIADEYVSFHNKNPLLKEEDLVDSYHCPIHQGWHVGHVDLGELPPHIKIQKLLDELKRN